MSEEYRDRKELEAQLALLNEQEAALAAKEAELQAEKDAQEAEAAAAAEPVVEPQPAQVSPYREHGRHGQNGVGAV
jgi:hypothetical protein